MTLASDPHLEPRGAARPWSDVTGACGDLGVMMPLLAAMILGTGVSATAALVCAGLFYLFAAAVYRAPVPVQPMKVVSAVAVAEGLSSDVIAAAALLLSLSLLVLGRCGAIDRLAAALPLWLVRGVQVAVGFALLRVAYHLLADAAEGGQGGGTVLSLAPIAIAVSLLLLWRPWTVVPMIAIGFVVVAVQGDMPGLTGPSPISGPSISAADLERALLLLVIPQLPLTVTSSCVATGDAMVAHHGERGRRARPGRLAQTIGVANLLVAATAAVPMCHGSGGVSAHHAFGARTWRTPLLIGSVLCAVGLLFGAEVVRALDAFPSPLLAGMLLVTAAVHLRLVMDLDTIAGRVAAVALGCAGFVVGLAPVVLVAGAVLVAVRRLSRSQHPPRWWAAMSADSVRDDARGR